MNEIRLYGSVGMSFWDEDYFTAEQVRAQISGMSGPLTVRINSAGGIAVEGNAIYTMLVDYPGEVHVIIDAVAMSAASLIAMAGDTITMRLGSYLLIHDPAQGYLDGRGTSEEHRRAAAQLDVIAGAYAAVYAKRAGISIDEARQIMRDETVMDGPMALQMGFATATDDTPADPVARFNYGIYAHAPEALRAACKYLGQAPGKAAVLAMMAGLRPNIPKKETMMTVKPTDDPAVETAVETKTPTAQTVDDSAPGGAAPVAHAMSQTAIAKIRNTVALGGFAPEMALDMIARGLTPDQALTEVLAKRKQEDIEMSGAPHSGHAPARITADARDKFKTGAQLALMAKCGLGGERNEFSSLTLSEVARASIEMAGERASFTDRRAMVGRAFTMAGTHTTSDFGTILSNVMGKAVLKGWEEAEETYHLWTSKGALPDFKDAKRVGLGGFDALRKVSEGADYKYVTIGERGETIALATYGELIRISRQAIINDDLDMFGKIPMKMGRAARRTIGDLVYAVLTSNPNMSDGVALFHATHANLAGTAAAPNVTSLSQARAAMKTQKEKAGGTALNISPSYLIVPAALETVAQQHMVSTVDPTANKGHASNPVAGMAEVVADGRLDAASSTAWYLAANPGAFDTIEVAYLDGVEAPMLEEQAGWTSDGTEMKVRIDAGVAPLDFRTLYKNAGA
ncbi:ClpP-like prohead protease/major capsid protein fusion protein [Rhodobacter capsulatus]|uniref:ClpP-like prohead protease/major capsid protein fusion protein n=1 Tax=Rhodobacter capsulatus TaxID=1061 RepID=UPI004029A669